MPEADEYTIRYSYAFTSAKTEPRRKSVAEYRRQTDCHRCRLSKAGVSGEEHARYAFSDIQQDGGHSKNWVARTEDVS